ncbi:hypothetical protein LZ554_009005 [Drepanopeziza brunnea f. sp. 'monogermtubi']|nr:hypothetical protein LZ554_009005 [Drepanopeziza brunnea f. sp. 'monogermtubi']
MSGLVNYLFNTLSAAIFGTEAEEEEERMPTAYYDCDRYTPSTEDVLSVKDFLWKEFELPLELVDSIIDFAEYWPRTTTCRTGGELHVRSGRSIENQFLLRSYPLGYIPNDDAPTICPMMSTGNHEFPVMPAEPYISNADLLQHDNREEVFSRWTEASQIRGEHACRKIVFTIVSHDQGWGGSSADRGTYKGSYTWFDVGKETIHTFEDTSVVNRMSRDAFPVLLPRHGAPVEFEGNVPLACTVETTVPTVNSSSPDRFEHPLMPTMKSLQKNLTATRQSQEHKITWSFQDNIVNPDSVAGTDLESQGRGSETANGAFVKDMKVGDMVTVWAKARFPGWVNIVESVKIDVYYAV